MNETETTPLLERLAATVPDREPPIAELLAAGRGARRRRTTLLLSSTVVATALTIGTVAGLGALISRGTPDSGGTERWANNYDPQAMPKVLDERARDTFERTFSRLPDAAFAAKDGMHNPLAPADYGRASSMELRYALTESRVLRVYLGHARSEAEGDPERMCATGLASGLYVECEVFDAAGETATVQTVAQAPIQVVIGLNRSPRTKNPELVVVTPDQMADISPDLLVFTRTVEVVKSDTLTTSVSETVPASTFEQASAAFRLSVSDMAELAADPALEIPPPDPGP